MLAAAAAHISALAAAAASGIKSAGWTLSVVLLLTTGAAICKYLTQLVDQRGCVALTSLSAALVGVDVETLVRSPVDVLLHLLHCLAGWAMAWAC